MILCLICRHFIELTTQKSVRKWTQFRRAISVLESVPDFDSVYDSDDDKCSVKSDHPFTIRHPFQLKVRKDIAIRVTNRSANGLALEW
jgi:hypothetical protein